MRAKIIATMNRKGGVGKSTINQHIAMLLAALGNRIGIVDTDSQGHAALITGMTHYVVVRPDGRRIPVGTEIPDLEGFPAGCWIDEDREVNNGLFRALIENAALASVVLEVPGANYALPYAPATGALFLLPSSDRTYKIPSEISPGKIFALLRLIETMIAQYRLDAVFIDTNPTLNLFDAWVFMAADAYLYVTECEQMAFDGIKAATQQIANVQQDRREYLKRDAELLGIIPNKFRANTYIHKRNIKHLGEAFPGKVWHPVTLRTDWVEATELHRPVYQSAPNKQAARDIHYIVGKVQEALGWSTATATN